MPHPLSLMSDRPSRNPAVWLGPLLTVAGVATYPTVLARFAAVRDVPWVSVPAVVLGVAVSLYGAIRSFERGVGVGRRVLAVALTLAAGALAARFLYDTLVASYRLPEPTAETIELRDAPDFTLRASTGGVLRLSDLRGRPVLLLFFRGAWSPYCRSELSDVQSELPRLRKRGVLVLAISVDPLETCRRVAERLGLDFPVLSDPEGRVVAAYGLLHRGGGPGGSDVARPAAIFVAPDGRIAWSAMTRNWRVRLRADRIVETIDRLGSAAAEREPGETTP